MKTGTLQHRWSKEQPIAYEKDYRIVRFDIAPQKNTDENGDLVDGFSYVEVQLDKLIDYGHIKSQLIESGYAQKDEFGLLMNSVGDIVTAITEAKSFDELKKKMSTEDVSKFIEFMEFRKMCAEVAKEVMNNYK